MGHQLPVHAAQAGCRSGIAPGRLHAKGSRIAARGGSPVGVHCVKWTGKYLVNLAKYGIKTYLGTFNTSEEAFYVYKLEKEKHIKEVADKWKDHIDIRVYEALMNYEVSIYD